MNVLKLLWRGEAGLDCTKNKLGLYKVINELIVPSSISGGRPPTNTFLE